MKYLVMVRVLNEPDNNTPADVIWAKITDIEPKDMAKCEKTYIDEFETECEYGAEVDFYPLAELDEEWVKVAETR